MKKLEKLLKQLYPKVMPVNKEGTEHVEELWEGIFEEVKKIKEKRHPHTAKLPSFDNIDYEEVMKKRQNIWGQDTKDERR